MQVGFLCHPVFVSLYATHDAAPLVNLWALDLSNMRTKIPSLPGHALHIGTADSHVSDYQQNHDMSNFLYLSAYSFS